MNYTKRIARKKKRRYLIISAASAYGGLQCLYITISGDEWNVIQHQITPYPQALRKELEDISRDNGARLSLADLGNIDVQFSRFVQESVRAFLLAAPPLTIPPDCIILNRILVCRNTENVSPFKAWNISIGEPQLLATTFNTPVLTDFIRQDIVTGGSGILPLTAGDIAIAQKAGGCAALVNIGLISHMSIIDSHQRQVLVDSDTGPGTSLINQAARQAGCDEGFDRDGSAGSARDADTAVLETLASFPWFDNPAPKSATSQQFDCLLNEPAFLTLAPPIRLATVTALTARTIYNFFKNNCPDTITPDAVWVSGGGVRNLTLLEYLKNYFSPLAVRNVEEIGIPAQNRVLLSLALSVDAHIRGVLPKRIPIGKWIVP